MLPGRVVRGMDGIGLEVAYTAAAATSGTEAVTSSEAVLG